MNFGLALYDRVEKVDGRDSCFTVVREECDKTGVPLISDLCEGGGARRHENLADAVVKLGNVFLGYLEESMRCSFLAGVVNQSVTTAPSVTPPTNKPTVRPRRIGGQIETDCC